MYYKKRANDILHGYFLNIANAGVQKVSTRVLRTSTLITHTMWTMITASACVTDDRELIVHGECALQNQYQFLVFANTFK